MQEKIAKRIERVFKGVANRKRAKILDFIGKEDNTTLWQISQGLDIELKNVSQHTARMEKAGLIEKYHVGQSVHHELTPYGEKVLEFIRNLK